MSLNPLDLRGPEFLALYVGLLLLGSLFVRAVRRSWESTAGNFDLLAEDPYKLAALRGDTLELVMVSVVSMTERDLVETLGGRLFLKDPEARQKVRRPLDKAVLSRLDMAGAGPNRDLTGGRTLGELSQDGVVCSECRAIEAQLMADGYLPDTTCIRNRHLLAWSTTAVLWLLGLTKLLVALERGHHNVGFLVLLLTATPIVMHFLIRPRRTASGDEALARAQDWYSRLRDNRASLQVGGSSGELTCLAAVYGLTMLPPAMAALLPPIPRPAGLGSSGGDFGTSDGGGSSCSSGSSSCGGGGCGGCGGGGD
jgi:uncharacterized protein (TIGR04222 family)